VKTVSVPTSPATTSATARNLRPSSEGIMPSTVPVDPSPPDLPAVIADEHNYVRPRAIPAPGIDAYVWAKPPGESDGSATLSPIRGFNPMCDPTYGGGIANDFKPSNAVPGAPTAANDSPHIGCAGSAGDAICHNTCGTTCRRQSHLINDKWRTHHVQTRRGLNCV
jgi:Glycosyl hydrolases family 6